MARSDTVRSAAFLTSGVVSTLATIPQQTLISWDRSGVLKAASRPGRRSSDRAPRRYDQAGLTAALFARSAMDMGFRGHALKQIVPLMQAGDRTALKRAAVYAYSTGPGLMKHLFSLNLNAPDDKRYIAWLRGQKRLVGEPTSLWTIREYLWPIAGNAMSGRAEGPLTPQPMENE